MLQHANHNSAEASWHLGSNRSPQESSIARTLIPITNLDIHLHVTKSQFQNPTRLARKVRAFATRTCITASHRVSHSPVVPLQSPEPSQRPTGLCLLLAVIPAGSAKLIPAYKLCTVHARLRAAVACTTNDVACSAVADGHDLLPIPVPAASQPHRRACALPPPSGCHPYNIPGRFLRVVSPPSQMSQAKGVGQRDAAYAAHAQVV